MNHFSNIFIFLALGTVSVAVAFFLKSQHLTDKPVTLYLMWEPQAQFLGYYAARDRGFFSDEGIDVNIKHDLGFGESFHEILSKPDTFAINLLSNTVEWLAESTEFTALSIISKGCNMGWLSVHPKNQLKQKMSDAQIFSWWGSQDILFKNFILENKFSLSNFAARAHVGDPDPKRRDWVVLVMAYNELVDYREHYDPEQNFATYCELGQPIFEDILVGAKARTPEQKLIHKKMVRAIWKGWDWSVAHPESALDLLMSVEPRRNRTIQKYQLNMFARNLSRRADRTRDYSGNLKTIDGLVTHNLVQRPGNLAELRRALTADTYLRELGI